MKKEKKVVLLKKCFIPPSSDRSFKEKNSFLLLSSELEKTREMKLINFTEFFWKKSLHKNGII